MRRRASPAEVRVQVFGRDYDFSARGFAWEKPDALESVDGTVEIEVRQIASSNEALGIIHDRLSRIAGGGPFAIPLEGTPVEVV